MRHWRTTENSNMATSLGPFLPRSASGVRKNRSALRRLRDIIGEVWNDNVISAVFPVINNFDKIDVLSAICMIESADFQLISSCVLFVANFKKNRLRQLLWSPFQRTTTHYNLSVSLFPANFSTSLTDFPETLPYDVASSAKEVCAIRFFKILLN